MCLNKLVTVIKSRNNNMAFTLSFVEILFRNFLLGKEIYVWILNSIESIQFHLWKVQTHMHTKTCTNTVTHTNTCTAHSTGRSDAYVEQSCNMYVCKDGGKTGNGGYVAMLFEPAHQALTINTGEFLRKRTQHSDTLNKGCCSHKGLFSPLNSSMA